ncbi:MAG: hypothetical protein O3B13_25425 [Planctomycetota bacterium]|nr:hypothetical protein [Planctomycetota bacterium]
MSVAAGSLRCLAHIWHNNERRRMGLRQRRPNAATTRGGKPLHGMGAANDRSIETTIDVVRWCARRADGHRLSQYAGSREPLDACTVDHRQR